MRLRKLIYTVGLAAMFHIGLAQDRPPEWVIRGILKTETRSYYREDGSIKYIDMRRGSAGERGPFQMTRGAFNQVKRRGEEFWKIEVDRTFAEEMAIRYLHWLDTHYGKGNWYRNVEMYNAGPNNHSPKYLAAVLKHGLQ